MAKRIWEKFAAKRDWDESASEPSLEELDRTPAEVALDSLRRGRKLLGRGRLHLLALARQLFLSILVGVLSGALGTAFLYSMRFASDFFARCDALGIEGRAIRPIFFLPFAGLLIVALYRLFRLTIDAGTNQVVEALTNEKKASLWLAPSIFLGSTLTQFFGGSAGREGAALQLGGCVGLGTGRLLGLDGASLHIAILCGMSGGFAAVFGAPLTATIFALEIACVGVVYYPAFLPSLVAGIIGASFSSALGFAPFSCRLAAFGTISIPLVARALALGVGCGLVCVFFCSSIRFATRSLTRRCPNDFARVFFGGSLVVVATIALGTDAYNGSGFGNIAAALEGKALPQDFLLKTLFTAITLGAGFKGGEIVPALAVGATFGGVAGNWLGFDASQGAALGMIAIFSGATNCPLTALALSIELFGAQNALAFAVACGACYLTSGTSGLYRSQKNLFSKVTALPFDQRLREDFRNDLQILDDLAKRKTALGTRQRDVFLHSSGSRKKLLSIFEVVKGEETGFRQFF